MNILARLIARIIINIAALAAAVYFLGGITYSNNWKVLVLAGAVLGMCNAIVKPVLNAIAAPLNWFTFGLVIPFVISLSMIYITDWLVPGFEVINFWHAIVATIIIAIINGILGFIFVRNK